MLEAIFLLSGAKSFRGASADEIINYNSDEAFIQGEISDQLTNNVLEIKLGRKEKKYFKNANPVSFIDFYGHLLCISFTPDDLFLVKGAPLGRRQFMDRHIVDLNKNQLSIFMNYNRALKSKNRLLKESAGIKEIEAWNEIIILSGIKITLLRSDFIRQLEERANQIFSQYAEADGLLKLSLKSDFISAGEILNENQAASKLSEYSSREMIYKKSLIGSQRDDLEILFNNQPAGSYASQGQSKSIALSFKLALVEMIEAQRGESPVLILDDLESELDDRRNAKISNVLFDKKRQTFISGTSLPAELKDQLTNERIFKVSDGSIDC